MIYSSYTGKIDILEISLLYSKLSQFVPVPTPPSDTIGWVAKK